METDASHDRLSAILSQEQDGKQRVIAYASRRLRPSEKNSSLYSSMKLEFLAMKWAITEKLHHYLLGGHFTVITDNNPLTYFRSAKLGALEQRWAAQLAQFNFEIKYQPGKVNPADALTRIHLILFQNPQWWKCHQKSPAFMRCGVNNRLSTHPLWWCLRRHRESRAISRQSGRDRQSRYNRDFTQVVHSWPAWTINTGSNHWSCHCGMAS